MKKGHARNATRGKPVSPYTRDTDKLIQCRVCGQPCVKITPQHIFMHGMTMDGYREKFGVTFLSSNEYRRRCSRMKLKKYPENDYRPLNREQILAELRRYTKVSPDLSASFLQEAAPELFYLTRRVFGSWPNVRRALRMKPHPFRRWSEEKIIRAIWRHEAQGHPLSLEAMRRRDPKLVGIVYFYFGSWKNAIEMSGIDYATVKVLKDRSPKALSRDLKAWCRIHGPVGFKRLALTDKSLAKYLTYKYGSIKNAARVLKVPFRPENPSHPVGSRIAKKKRPETRRAGTGKKAAMRA